MAFRFEDVEFDFGLEFFFFFSLLSLLLFAGALFESSFFFSHYPPPLSLSLFCTLGLMRLQPLSYRVDEEDRPAGVIASRLGGKVPSCPQ